MPIHNPNRAVSSLVSDGGGRGESTLVAITIPDTGVHEVQTLTFPATSGAAQGDYIVVSNAAGVSRAIWLDIDADGTAPTGAAFVAADAAIEVDVVGAGTAAENGTLVDTAISVALAALDVTVVDNLDGTLTLTQDLLGNTSAPDPHNTGDTGAGSISGATDTAGVASNYQDTFFTFRDSADTSRYIWTNVGGEGSDPSPGGTGTAVALSPSASAGTIAAALATGVNAISGLTSFIVSSTSLQIGTDSKGNVTDATVGDMPSISVTITQGAAEEFGPSLSPSALDNNP